MSELLPCPFCGSVRAPEVSDVGECEECSGFDDCGRRLENHTCEGCDRWERPMFVVCNYNISGCGASGPYRKTKAEAIAAWNSRAAMEFDNWFYLPKPKEPIVEVTETTHAWDGTKVKTDVFYQVQEQAVINWAKELDEHIIKRICEVWNSRAERTCHWELEHSGTLYDKWRCSKCGYVFVEPRCDQGYTDLEPNYCPNCGRKCI